jgi:hypothetical protein
MDNKNELKQLIKEQKDIVKQILQLQEKENNIIIKIRRFRRGVKTLRTGNRIYQRKQDGM